VILAVAGGKGGVGTSTLAFELAAALGAVAVDADLGMADLPVDRGPDLHDVLAGRAAPVEAVREDPVRLLPCGRTLAGARAADVGDLADVLRSVAEEYGDVVVDCPSGLRADVGVPLAVADRCLLVASPRGYALADAVRVRELARELGTGLVVVALNRAVEDPPTAAVARVLGAPVTAVPADPRLGDSLSSGRAAVETAPESAAAEAVRELADAVRACQSRRSV
jgi:septum site-determining protein MinD